MTAMRTLKNNKGFTLVELAIVLVIIGILLGGIIKGQELIKNAKMKRLYSTYREVTAATYSYYDRYGKYPGDDNLANTRGWGVPAGGNGNGNGFIDNTATAALLWCPAGDATENCYAWQELRAAGFLTGSTNNAAATSRMAPTHAFGGSVGLIGTAVLFGANVWNKPFSVCFQNLTDEVAAWLDRTYDDGVTATGSIRGNVNYMGASPNLTSSAYVCIEG